VPDELHEPELTRTASGAAEGASVRAIGTEHCDPKVPVIEHVEEILAIHTEGDRPSDEARLHLGILLQGQDPLEPEDRRSEQIDTRGDHHGYAVFTDQARTFGVLPRPTATGDRQHGQADEY
jgi:hypothetical protein